MCDRGYERGDLNARWQDREDARKRVRSAPNDRGLRRAVKVTTKQLKRTRAEAVQRFFEDYVSQLEGRIQEDDQFGFTNTSRGWMWKGRRRFTRSSSMMRKIDSCGIMPSSASGG